MKVTFKENLEQNTVEIYLNDNLIRTQNIHTDENGRRYIYVPNVYHPNGGRFSFLHRPGDAIRAIQDGYGDVLKVEHLMVRTEHLVRFLDRKYGEELRAKSLEGWKDAEFTWVVSERCGFLGNIPLSVADVSLPIHHKGDARMYPIKYYNSEEEAQAFIDNISSELMPKIEKYRALPTVKEKDAYYEQELKQYTGLKESIILSIADEDGKIPLFVQQVIKESTMPMQKIFVHVIERMGNTEAYMCKGDALDSDATLSEWMVKEQVLYSTADVNERFKNSDGFWIYRLTADEHKTDWFSSLQLIFDSDEYQTLLKYVDETNCDYVDVERAVLRKQKLFPIVPTKDEPFEAIVEAGEKGLVVFANLNPDKVGSIRRRRKVYFPDKSCASNICAGKVKITGIKDKGKYGFFTGEMIPCEIPSEDELAQWLLDNIGKNIFPNSMITFIKNPLWGDAIQIRIKAATAYCTKDSCGDVTTCNLVDLYDHSKDKIIEEISVEDFLCSGYAGATMTELCGMVPEVDNIPVWECPEQSIKFISEDFDTAVDCGLISLCCVRSVVYCVIFESNMLEAASVLQRKLIPVLEKAAELNRNAKARFAARKRINKKED